MKPEKQTIHDDPKLQRFFRKRNHKPKTRLLITDRFYYYYLATGLTPTSMIDEADMEEEQGIRLRRRKIIEHLDTFEDYLQDRYSENTIRSSISTIRTFYRHHHIEIPHTNRKPRNHENPLTVDDLPGLGDIRRAVNEARNTRDEAIIILMASSGMGKAEIIHLNWQHLINAISKYREVTVEDLFNIAQTRPEWTETIGPLTWTVQRIKTGHTYTTFSSPESFEKLLDYLQSRKHTLIDNSDPIFITNRSKRFNEDNLGEVFTRINRRCGFGVGKDGLHYFRSHNLRKWFANQLRQGMTGDDVQKLLGHTEHNATRGAYLKPNIDYLYGLYYDNVALVTVMRDVEVHNRTDEIVQEQEERIKRLEKDKQNMKDDLERVKKALKMKYEK